RRANLRVHLHERMVRRETLLDVEFGAELRHAARDAQGDDGHEGEDEPAVTDDEADVALEGGGHRKPRTLAGPRRQCNRAASGGIGMCARRGGGRSLARPPRRAATPPLGLRSAALAASRGNARRLAAGSPLARTDRATC